VYSSVTESCICFVDLKEVEIVPGGNCLFYFFEEFEQCCDCEDDLNEVKFKLDKLFD
jgi:hypothetical protein